MLLPPPAVTGKSYKGDIAIDDLSIAPGQGCTLYSGTLPPVGASTQAPITTAHPNNCNGQQFGCVSTGVCVSLSKLCDFNKDCSDGSDERTCRKFTNSNRKFQDYAGTGSD